MTCFVTPLIVTVVCYSGIMKVACHQARQKPPITFGRFSVSEPDHSTIPDVSKVEGADGKKKKGKNPGRIVCGNENRVFIVDSESHRDGLTFELGEASFSQGKSESTLTEHNTSAIQGPSRVIKIFDQTTDPAHREHEPGNPGTSKSGQDQTSHMHTERMHETKGKTSENPSGSVRMIHLDPVVIVVSPGNSEISSGKGKHPAGASINPLGRIGKSRVSPVAVVSPVINHWTEEIPQRSELKVIKEEGKHRAGASINPSGKFGKSRVGPAAVVSPVINRWTEEIPQRREQKVIKEEEERTDSRKYFTSRVRSVRLPGHLARMRSWMAGRRTEDGRQRR